MDASVKVTTKVSPKSLPMKYKAMLFASMSFINSNVMDLVLREELFSKLPIHKTVEEQIAYFDEEANLKKIEQTIYKPMLKEHKKQEKNTNKPVKEKKTKETPIKKKKADEEVKTEEVAVVSEATLPEEKELEFETEYPNAKLETTVEVSEKLETEVKKPEIPRLRNPQQFLVRRRDKKKGRHLSQRRRRRPVRRRRRKSKQFRCLKFRCLLRTQTTIT